MVSAEGAEVIFAHDAETFKNTSDRRNFTNRLLHRRADVSPVA
jgi:hypothetical protein